MLMIEDERKSDLCMRVLVRMRIIEKKYDASYSLTRIIMPRSFRIVLTTSQVSLSLRVEVVTHFDRMLVRDENCACISED